MRRERAAHSTEPARSSTGTTMTSVAPVDRAVDGPTTLADGFPVFAVREWAARYYEQERLTRDAAWWRLAWPFGMALVLVGGAAVVVWHWQARVPDLAFGAALVLAAGAVGMVVGGLIRLRVIRARRKAAAARPATLESVPETARAAVLDSPRLRFRRPTDGAGFAAIRDNVAAAAPVGQFAASVLVWALVMRDHTDGTLEDWVRGRDL